MGSALSILTKCSVFSTVVPLLTYLARGRKLNKLLRILFVYLIVSLITDLFCFYGEYKSLNHYVINVFTYFEFVCFSLILTMRNDTLKYKSFIPLCLAFTFGFVLSFIYTRNPGQINNFVNCFEAMILIILSIINLFELNNDLSIPNLFQYPYFWILASTLLYFSVVLFVFIFSGYILDPAASKPVKFLWIIHNSVHILFNLLIAVSIILWKRIKV